TKEFVRRIEGENAPVNFLDAKPAPKPAPAVKHEPEPTTPATPPKPTPESSTPLTPPKPTPESSTPATPPKPTPESSTPATPPKPTPEPAPAPAPKPAAVIEPPAPVKHPKGDYEKGIIDDVIDMLPESEKGMWIQIFAPIYDVSRGEIDVHTLRDDFEDSDKDRYTFYVLNDESDTFWPVMYPDQIIEPLRCVIKLDEYGAAEVYM
ncbi:MAG: hypothetical protein IJQ58_12550, partial [Synergistaceae bacterium]|nr:hypothetical protein [Synergistaceae bacterium]